MGRHYCEDCGREMEPDCDDFGEFCDRCDNEDFICERCADDRLEHPSCSYCKKGCSKCLEHTDIDFTKCKCESCPMNWAYEARDMCAYCFEEQAEKYGCRNGCKVWIVAKCGHTTCTAFQFEEETPEGECPECFDHSKLFEERKAAEAAEKEKQIQAEAKDAPGIKKLLSTVASESAKVMLTQWVNDHPKDEAGRKAKEIQASAKDGPAIKKLLSTVTSESAKVMLSQWVNDHPKACEEATASKEAASVAKSSKNIRRKSKRKR